MAIDIDEDDAHRAATLSDQATGMLGGTPAVRLGRHPRQALIYRAAGEVRSRPAAKKVEVLAGSGHQLVAFNQHRDTGLPYRWPGDTPLVLDALGLPKVGEDQVERFLRSIGQADARRLPPVAPVEPQVDNREVVVDGRDLFLTRLVAAEIGARKAQGRPLARDEIIRAVWLRFCDQADLTRTKGSGGGFWSMRDVAETRATRCARIGRLASGRKPAAESFGRSAGSLPSSDCSISTGG